MACSDSEGKAVMPLKKEPEDVDFISGITEGLEDFLEGHSQTLQGCGRAGSLFAEPIIPDFSDFAWHSFRLQPAISISNSPN